MHNLQFSFPRKRAVFELPVIYATKGKVAFLNAQYPWYDKNLSHDEIVKMRKTYFIESRRDT